MAIPFRHSAGFGRRMEYWLIGKMLKEGLDVYVPLVDDFGIDAVIRKRDNTFVEVQIKARSLTVKQGNAALFAAIDHPELRRNYYFIFHSERLESMWIMSSEEFIKESIQTKTGKNAGLRTIWLNGMRTDKVTGAKQEYGKARYDCYLDRNSTFSRFKEATNLIAVPVENNAAVLEADLGADMFRSAHSAAFAPAPKRRST